MFEGYGQQLLAVQPSQRQPVDVSLWAWMTGLPVHYPDLYTERRFGYFTLCCCQLNEIPEIFQSDDAQRLSLVLGGSHLVFATPILGGRGRWNKKTLASSFSNRRLYWSHAEMPREVHFAHPSHPPLRPSRPLECLIATCCTYITLIWINHFALTVKVP